MARKKAARKKKSVSKKKPAQKKKLLAKKPAAKKKAAVKKKAPAKKKPAKKKSSARRTGEPSSSARAVGIESRRGLGAESAGQSGDTQGLSRREYSDSESVEELLEEGQYAEAEAVAGVENARDPDEGEVKTSEFPEDDVPEEYRDQD
ncbi:MAG TPA: hypothetical protein VIB39_21610 [Candidatus Angelobacter sp.]|jgi:hypothetical protein